MKTVGHPVAASADKRRWHRTAFIRKIACERVAALELQPLRETLFHFDGYVVVIALRAVLHALEHAPDRIRHICGCNAVALRVRRNLVEVRHCFEIRSVAAGVGESQPGSETQLSLKRQIPLLHRWV